MVLALFRNLFIHEISRAGGEYRVSGASRKHRETRKVRASCVRDTEADASQQGLEGISTGLYYC